MLTVTEDTIGKIMEFEGFDQPSKWPGGGSGITIGVGYDLGYVTVDQFESDWGDAVSADVLKRLKAAIGKRAVAASNRAADFADIKIPKAAAEKVFRTRTVPLFGKRTEIAFPGVTDLPAPAQGALLSLVFNRGTSMIGPTRTEMAAIRAAVPKKDLRNIAAELRSMKRLWEGKGLDGLIKRREAEAVWVESAIA